MLRAAPSQPRSGSFAPSSGNSLISCIWACARPNGIGWKAHKILLGDARCDKKFHHQNDWLAMSVDGYHFTDNGPFLMFLPPLERGRPALSNHALRTSLREFSFGVNFAKLT